MVTTFANATQMVNPRLGGPPECRVLQVFSSLAMGGAEKWLMSLLRYAHDSADALPVKLKVDVLLTGGARAEFDDEAEALGARLFYLTFSRPTFLGFIRKFRHLLAEGRYHVIHDHQDYAAGFRLMAGLGHLPEIRIAHVHNTSIQLASYNNSRIRRFAFEQAKRFLGRHATHITGTSSPMLTEFGFDDPYFSSVNRRVLHCGFDVSSFRGDKVSIHTDVCREFGWGSNSKILLFVGRLDDPAGFNLHRKRPDFALEIARECIRADPQIRMLMAGSGDTVRSELKTKVDKWGLTDKIRLIGQRNDVNRLMLGSDLFLFPALEEGLGMVVVEAQAAGLRVLTSTGVPRESSVVPEIVQFKPLSDGIASWTDEALRLLRSPDPDASKCNSAVQDSNFSIENSARELIDIYTSGFRL